MNQPNNNLPFQLTSLVGREREISEVEGLLGETRLLTLTGPGGSGKTRLALAVASGVLEGFVDGAWLVELAPLSDPELVPQAVASVFGVRETSGTTLSESLTDYLLSKKTLLVLDNCEHLVSSCASLAGTLLRSCPNLRILATSREALDVLGETLFVVPPLSLPDPRHLPAIENLPHYDAARLFLERAKALKPGFEITEGNAMAVAQVCYRLDGIPLAIELAAARTKVLSVEQISNRLEESLRLLSAGGRTAMPHHRTLRATMDWSHGLLTQKERVLLRRLSVFAGGFTLEPAEGVCMGGSIGEGEVLDLLASLTDKSLVLFEERQDGWPRYRLLETIRQYALERLEESGEAERVRERHAMVFLELAERAHPELMGEGQVEWLERLEQEYGNLRAAMSWALDATDAATGARMGWALWQFWWIRGHHREGRRWIEAALKSDLPPGLRGRALVVAGTLAFSHGDYQRCEACSKEALELSRQVGDELGAAWARVGLGVVAMIRTDHEAATPHLEEALRTFHEFDEYFGVARVTTCLGMVALMRGEEAKATPMFEEGLAVARRIGDRTTAYITLYSLASLALSRRDHNDAATLFEEGITVSEQVGDRANVAYCLRGLATVAGARDQPERWALLAGAAERLLEAAGFPVYNYYEPDPYLYERTMEEMRVRLGEEAFEAACTEGREMTPERAVEYALEKPETPEDAAIPPERPAGLSAREVEVLRLVAGGMTNARIAEELFISPRTVNGHLTSAYHKIGSHSRAEAARFASEHGLLL